MGNPKCEGICCVKKRKEKKGLCTVYFTTLSKELLACRAGADRAYKSAPLTLLRSLQ